MDTTTTYKTGYAWGYIHWIHPQPELCIKELHFFKGGATSFHSHTERNETLFISSGRFRIRILYPESGITDTQDVGIGTRVFIRPNTHHQITAITEGTIIELTKNYNENDIVRYERPSLIDDGNTETGLSSQAHRMS
jgi:mannose-6-phosphate isomerase-like protein (cupin superfamily)